MAIPKLTVLTLIALIGATAFSIDVTLPAIPATAKFFGAEIGVIQLTISLYILGYGLGQIPIGALSDHFGRRPLVLICMSLFVVFATVAAFSTSITALLIFRFLQGLVGASGAVMARAIARDLTEGPQTGRLMSLLTSMLGVVMIVAPIAGALAMEMFGWRAPFFASALFGGAALILMWTSVPESLQKQPRSSILERLSRGIRAFAASPPSLLGALVFAFTFATLLTYVTLSSEAFINTFGTSAKGYAAIYAIASVGYFIGGLIIRQIIARHEKLDLMRRTAMGFALCGLCLALSLALGLQNIVLFIAISIALFTFIGMMLALTTALALEPLAKTAGMAAAIMGTFQLLVASLITSGLALLQVDIFIRLQGALAVLSGIIFCITILGSDRVRRART